MELALFIKKRLDAGDQKKAIAKSLGKDGAIITHHLALIDPPACIEDAYSNGRCTSPKALYVLRGLHEKFPEQVETWCASVGEITRVTVAALADELNGRKKPAPAPNEDQQSREPAGNGEPSKFVPGQIPGGAGEGQGVGREGGEPPTTTLPFHNPSIEKDDKGLNITDPNKIKKPLLLVEFDGREAMVLLNRRPTTVGLIFIRFEDGSGEQEVPTGDCKMNLLTESEK